MFRKAFCSLCSFAFSQPPRKNGRMHCSMGGRSRPSSSLRRSSQSLSTIGITLRLDAAEAHNTHIAILQPSPTSPLGKLRDFTRKSVIPRHVITPVRTCQGSVPFSKSHISHTTSRASSSWAACSLRISSCFCACVAERSADIVSRAFRSSCLQMDVYVPAPWISAISLYACRVQKEGPHLESAPPEAGHRRLDLGQLRLDCGVQLGQGLLLAVQTRCQGAHLGLARS